MQTIREIKWRIKNGFILPGGSVPSGRVFCHLGYPVIFYMMFLLGSLFHGLPLIDNSCYSQQQCCVFSFLIGKKTKSKKLSNWQKKVQKVPCSLNLPSTAVTCYTDSQWTNGFPPAPASPSLNCAILLQVVGTITGS